MTITDGRFSQGSLNFPGEGTHQLERQFGGTNQARVVGYTLGSALNSVFYGMKR